MMTLAQIEERLTALEQVKERLAVLERIVDRLQSHLKSESDYIPSIKEEANNAEEKDIFPGTEQDLVITVPPEKTIYFRARIVSIEPGPPGLPLSAQEWASLGLEDEDE